jgi:hypothetical protein
MSFRVFDPSESPPHMVNLAYVRTSSTRFQIYRHAKKVQTIAVQPEKIRGEKQGEQEEKKISTKGDHREAGTAPPRSRTSSRMSVKSISLLDRGEGKFFLRDW